MKQRRRSLLGADSVFGVGVLLFLAALQAGCERQENKYVAPPPPEVGVVKPLQRPVTEYLELTGNTQAYETVDLKARVEGFLTKILFKDGDIVKKGDLLFVIEPEPYEAKLKLAAANVQASEAKLVRARQEYQRQLLLIKDSATSQSEVEKWRAQMDAAQATLDENRANADLARITLGYTQVRAPFPGRIDRHLVDLGNLVGSGSATKLATLYRIDPMYAYFNINERDLVPLMEKERANKRNIQDDKDPVPVTLGIEGQEGYPYKGTLDYASTSLDPGTGTLQLRGIFPNPVKKGPPALLPGMFVRVRVPVSDRENALLVPDRAMGADQGGRYLLLVDEKGNVEQRHVKTGPLEGQLRVIEEGLKGDESVVVDGLLRARPGAKVKPVPQQSPGADRTKDVPSPQKKAGT